MPGKRVPTSSSTAPYNNQPMTSCTVAEVGSLESAPGSEITDDVRSYSPNLSPGQSPGQSPGASPDHRSLSSTQGVYLTSTPIMSTSSSDGEPILSSASAIMSRHEKKKKKWYRRLGQQVKKSLGSKSDLVTRQMSRSEEELIIVSGQSVRMTSSSYNFGHANSMVNLTQTVPDAKEYRRTTLHELPMDRCASDQCLLGGGVVPLETQSLPTMSPKRFHQLQGQSDLSLSTLDSDQSDIDSRSDTLDDDSAISVTSRIIYSLEEKSDFQELNIRQRQQALMQHSFFVLEVWLREGRDLVVRDSCGTSDPYVKFKIGNKQHYKSKTVYKNLNPQWDERLSIPIEDVYRPVNVKVFDYDRGISDDPMGSAEIDLTTLELNTATDLKLPLADGGKNEEYMGYLVLQCTLTPKTIQEKETTSFKTKGTAKGGDSSKKLKMQIWCGVVTIVLVEGRNLVPMDNNGYSDPYVKFRLGAEKYKSKFKTKTLNPTWLEQFDLRMYDDQSRNMEITVYDHDVTGRDDFMGRAVIDLSQVKHELTHTFDQALEDGAGIIKILLTVSGTCGTETISDLSNFTANPRDREEIMTKYRFKNSIKNLKDIGWLQVKVFRAQNLASADIGGKSDPFCVLELVNSRLQTQTEYKTLNPDWNKVFTFNVKDIHSVLEVTVYDEDRDKKVEFLGKVAIPILNIKRCERRWYSLKDKKLMRRGKGVIQLELDFMYNHLKAAIRTVNPKEEKYMQPDPKFKISVMKRNIDRVSQIASSFIEGGKFIQSCFDWESRARSISAFIAYLVIVWCFELYMLPITLLIIFLKNFIIVSVTGAFAANANIEDIVQRSKAYVDSEDEDDDDDKDKKKEEKKSFKEKLHAIQEVCLQVQQGMDMAASLGERVKNTFNWTVPWLSMLAVIALTIGIVVLYSIPLRFLILAWGINKFTKKLRAPNAIPNNELLDFLSRVPSDSELIQYRELRPDPQSMSKKSKQA
ncbi:multiple C2 and transmembrane domain-containing protein 1-like isoform X3 [Mizuhopecten yessoensis]|uniref:multiple C2 and transmembrane domain-containing protein 1-like isoform X3 n=1 Tax=Mizuhopecten yessoensis TaxID=6573 RepID=UPI000B459434|nr:multiple C2 and transmembrane domain-containing protein 1-like isoform X3 [Mizuhopecten yessoensis]